MSATPRVIEVKGLITTEDGQVREFSLDGEGWFQWGNVTERLGDTVGVVQAMSDAVFRAES